MEKCLSCEQVAERYGVKTQTVHAWVREKKLQAINTGKNYIIRPQDLIEFEESRLTKKTKR